MRKEKRGIMSPTLLGWIIAITILLLVIVFAVLLKDKLADMVVYIKDLFGR